jgi:hypothetical protein
VQRTPQRRRPLPRPPAPPRSQHPHHGLCAQAEGYEATALALTWYQMDQSGQALGGVFTPTGGAVVSPKLLAPRPGTTGTRSPLVPLPGGSLGRQLSPEPRRRLDAQLLLAAELPYPPPRHGTQTLPALSLASKRSKHSIALAPPAGSCENELSLSPNKDTARLSPFSMLEAVPALPALPALPARAGQLAALENRARHPGLSRVRAAPGP